jgi:hypothetical protein
MAVTDRLTWRNILLTITAVLVLVFFAYAPTLGVFLVASAAVIALALVLDPLGYGLYDRIRNFVGGT